MTAPPERIRVIHLVLSLNLGGLETMLLNLARNADLEAFDLRVLCLRQPGVLAAQFRQLGVPVESLDCPELPKARTLFRLIRRLRQLRPHVLHTHNPSPHMFGAVAAHAAGVPVLIHTKHGRNYPHQYRAVVVNRLASLLTGRVVAVSQATAEIARRVERVPARKLTVIPNGIDLTRFVPAPDRGTGAGTRAIHVARLDRIKDQPTLLRAARIVADAIPGFCLDMVGDGPIRAELLALAEELGLGGNVRFLGARNDVNTLLAGADFFVLSSISEGIPMTLLEAQAAGLPAVVTDVGGNREVVIDGETGLLVPPCSPEALAEGMLSLLRDPTRARLMGERGRCRVEALFDARGTAAKYEQLYLDLLGAKLAVRQRPRCASLAAPTTG